jgi:hypothetical protein
MGEMIDFRRMTGRPGYLDRINHSGLLRDSSGRETRFLSSIGAGVAHLPRETNPRRLTTNSGQRAIRDARQGGSVAT